ncbi:MAG: hypothetical protein ACOYWZ_08715 [Bacillota bacterium]
MKPQKVCSFIKPIVQPTYINQMAAPYSPIYPVPSVPQPTQYITLLDPVFVDHLSRHDAPYLICRTQLS